MKSGCQVRWHPSFIRWCLNLKLTSSAAYRTLRSTGTLVLPSERTLRDYTHWMKSDSGFLEIMDEQLMKEAKIDEVPDFESYVCLIFDEVSINEDKYMVSIQLK